MRKLTTWMSLAAGALAVSSALAADFPSEPIRLIVPLAPGGGGDMAARVVAEALGKELNTNVIVENRPGASATIGTAAGARARPDGHNLLLITDFHPINAALDTLERLDAPLPYDSLEDFEPIGQVLSLQIVLLANRDTGITSMAELVEQSSARANEGGLSAGTPGFGSPHNLAFLQMQQMGGFPLLMVPFGGSGPATTAVQGGQVDLAFAAVGPGMAMVEGGRVNAVAVSSDQRDPAAPEVPTIAESGFPEFSIASWMGIVAPKGVPEERLDLLSSALMKVLQQEDVAARLETAGMYAAPSTRDAFRELILSDTVKYQGILKHAPQP